MWKKGATKVANFPYQIFFLEIIFLITCCSDVRVIKLKRIEIGIIDHIFTQLPVLLCREGDPDQQSISALGHITSLRHHLWQQRLQELLLYLMMALLL